MYLDIIILVTSDSNSLDKYRTNRSIESIKKNSNCYEIIVHFIEIEKIKTLTLNSELCIFLVAGDLLEADYLEEVKRNYIPSKDIILQPGYTYCFDKYNRKIYKNIDIHSELACYDVLTLRYYASRHFVSKTNVLKNFLSDQNSLDSSFIWSYLLFLLSKDYVLMSLHEVITFEIIEKYFDDKSVKVFGDYSSNPPLSDSFYYIDVLRRQNINNIQVREKATHESSTTPMNLKSFNMLTEPTSNTALKTNDSTNLQSQQGIRKYISEQDITEAIKTDGLIKGINLTKARLLNRATERFKKKGLPVKDKIRKTKIDIKKTLNLK